MLFLPRLHPIGRSDLLLRLLLVTAVLIGIVWPVVEVISRSLVVDEALSLEVYHQLLSRYSGVMVDSLFSALLSTALTLLLAAAIAVYLAFCQSALKKIIFGVLLLTMISPPFVSSLAYIMLFGRRGYIIYHLLGISWNPYGMHGVILMQVLSNVSLAALLLVGMFAMLDIRLLEAARDLGVLARRTVCRVALPLAVPGLVAAGFIVFMKCLADFGTPIIIGGRFTLLATEAYLAVIGRANMPLAAAISVLILLPSLVAYGFYRHFLDKNGGATAALARIGSAGLGGVRLGPLASGMLAGLTWLFLLVMLVQYAAIFWAAVADFRHGHWVLTWDHIEAVRISRLPSFMRSLVYALLAGGLGSLLGALLAYTLERKTSLSSRLIDFWAMLPYVMPGPFFGLGYILAFNDEPLALTGTAVIVVMNCLFRQLPVSIRASSAGLSRIGSDVEQAAADLGAGRIRTFVHILFPLLRPTLLLSFVNTFTATMTTVGAIIFLITPQTKVATVELFNVLRDGDYGQGAVLASMLILTTLAVNLLASRSLLGAQR